MAPPGRVPCPRRPACAAEDPARLTLQHGRSCWLAGWGVARLQQSHRARHWRPPIRRLQRTMTIGFPCPCARVKQHLDACRLQLVGRSSRRGGRGSCRSTIGGSSAGRSRQWRAWSPRRAASGGRRGCGGKWLGKPTRVEPTACMKTVCCAARGGGKWCRGCERRPRPLSSELHLARGACASSQIRRRLLPVAWRAKQRHLQLLPCNSSVERRSSLNDGATCKDLYVRCCPPQPDNHVVNTRHPILQRSAAARCSATAAAPATTQVLDEAPVRSSSSSKGNALCSTPSGPYISVKYINSSKCLAHGVRRCVRAL